MSDGSIINWVRTSFHESARMKVDIDFHKALFLEVKAPVGIAELRVSL